MKIRDLSIVSVIAFLFVVSGVVPVVAYNWGSPLFQDTASEGDIDPPEDILSVDALYADGFVFFRFVMNYYLIEKIDYVVHIDFDKNVLTGENSTPSDIGSDFYLLAGCFYNAISPTDLALLIQLFVYGDGLFYVYYNLTANNGTAAEWSSPADIPNLPLDMLLNSTQAEISFGVNWTWITELMTTVGVPGDNTSMYLEFEAGWDSDWCPDRTVGLSDFIEWSISTGGGGVPGFSLGFVLIGLLNVLGIPVLLQKKQKKV